MGDQLRLDVLAPSKRAQAPTRAPETRMAPVDSSLCAGLFRTVDRRKSRHVGTRRKIQYNRRWFLLDSAWILGPDDLALFLVLAASAAKVFQDRHVLEGNRKPSQFYGCLLHEATKEEDWQRILPLFSRISSAEGEVSALQATRALLSRGNWAYLAPRQNLLVSECGLSKSQSAYDSIAESLLRLSAVTLTEISGPDANARSVRRLPGDDLLSFVHDENDKRVHILLNRELLTPIMGRMYVPVPVSETRQLGDVARLAHLYLCARMKEFVDITNTDEFDLNELARAVYAERDENNRIKSDQTADDVRDWCKKLRNKALGDSKALEEGSREPGPPRIADLPGWKVVWKGSRMVEITRPGSRGDKRLGAI